MFVRIAATIAAAATLAAPVSASQAEDLLEAMQVSRIIDVMRQEGLAYGDDIARDLLSGPNQAWSATVARIYDTDAMEEVVTKGFVEAAGDTDLTPLIEFFGTEGGRQVIELEIGAREAMADDGVEESARQAYRDLAGTDDGRLDLLGEFVEVNDLVEANVAGALNSNFMFYRGLVDGGAFAMTEAEILSQVWSQEEETRDDTTEWLYGFLLLAYGPLDDDVLETYVALSKTEAGRVMNRALFAGFDEMYSEISYALGLASANRMQGEDL